MILATIIGGLVWFDLIGVLIGGRLKRERSWQRISSMFILHGNYLFYIFDKIYFIFLTFIKLFYLFIITNSFITIYINIFNCSSFYYVIKILLWGKI